MRVLLVEMPDELSDYVAIALRVRWPDLSLLQARAHGEALQLVRNDDLHLALLHLPGPGQGSRHRRGLLFIAQIRTFSSMPLIVIGKSKDAMDRTRALDMGADDWISASFTHMELIARVNAILRRYSPGKRPGVSFFLDGDLSIDFAAHRVCIAGNPVKLTPIQYKILCLLAENEGKVCTSSELLRKIWGPNASDDKELLKLNIYRLRSKLETDPSRTSMIFTERGVGYIIRAPTPTK